MDITKLEDFLDNSGIVFLSYGGMLTQDLISNMTEALEKETEKNNVSISASTNIFTIFVELSQNMMNYSKSKSDKNEEFDPKGLVLVGYNKENESYYVLSRNIVDIVDERKLSPKLNNINKMTRDEVKQQYRQLRRSGLDKHNKGAGIGFLEISKRCDNIEFKFTPINENKYQFMFQANISNKKKGE